MNTRKSLTVDEAIRMLEEYRDKYSGSDELEVSVCGERLVSYSGLTVSGMEREDGPYCTLRVDDKYNLYNS